MSAALEIAGVTKRFGGVVAVDDVHLHAAAGRITGLIGPNGAGKTTLFDCISGAQQPDAGSVRLGEVDLVGLLPEERARVGLGRTFQRLQVFDGMTVEENLVVAAEARTSLSWRDLLRPRRSPDGSVVEHVGTVLERTGLRAVAGRLAGELPVGTLRLVELGRALCTRPQALLLDEPASGLDVGERPALRRLLHDLRTDDLTVLLVEHDLDLVLDVCDEIHVLDAGRIIARGTPEEIRRDPAVQRAYVGAGT